MLVIKNLEVTTGGKKILRGINLTVRPREIHVLMGPNGAGKTSLAMVLAGQTNYKITRGEITINDQSLVDLTPDQRAKLGLFVSFQKPVEISGVSLRNILKTVVKEQFEEKLEQALKDLKINDDFLTRSFENFSGGEGKKLELLQAKILVRQFLIFDEIDSGLDPEGLRLVGENLKKMAQKTGIVLITHNPRILKFLKPDRLHVLIRGQIIKTDGLQLIETIEKKGFTWLTKN